ncbi:D-glycero-beta-D-manno-heptose 1,7-bisphosphate 7-phosphatase [Coxiella endosymbiont of Amblyomma nuttalli]|uniref:D-glycero-beta-D-manno-heptose 1,7-bisphosphate 7-phosphatase n=1 Tax=Coxiella endosymbiont of Amblyomma nuttalli TaxID=2749996 RepID=UPI001BB4BC80|nr:D-glycero-beta-D-manno-heptose 1,7-bisphosphate 7-phosphatase [Coxiella endosymbiont of Amblyomma nuttalli]QTS83590.1 D-glycero-beta-D-manno-heptose-1,7-bisphosphate 7-phosphatase [Coxiella endosymbiont of Amblyomma nuttalli]
MVQKERGTILQKRKKLIILDRDGVINYKSENYIKNPCEWIPIPGSLEAIACLNKADYQVVVATNQSGVGRGYYSLDTLETIHEKMQRELSKVGGYVDRIYFCPHVPEVKCNCRKPKPGLLHLIANDFPEAFPSSTFIGDSLQDIQAGQIVGCQVVLVKTGNGEETIIVGKGLEAVSIYEDLQDFVNHLVLKSE